MPWKEETLIPMDAPSTLVPLELSEAPGGGRQAKAGRHRGAMLILMLLPAQKGGRWGEITLRFLGFGVGTVCELRHELLESRL